MLDALHPEQLNSFNQAPKDQPIAFLTRHSIREQPSNGFASYDIPLTEEGVRLAEALGGKLSRPVHQFYSSPVQRCLDTAMAMASGLGLENVPVEKVSCLVEPGSYVEDIEKVAGLFFKLGPLDFATKHLKGEVRGILSPEEGTRKILRHIKDTLGAYNSLTVHVTHDTILAAFVYYLLGINELSDDHWPWMMEGVVVWFDQGGVNWIWRGKQYSTNRINLD